MSLRRKGKIARLPKALRDRVCEMIRDGAKAKTIIAWLEEQRRAGAKCADGSPIPRINEANLSHWVNGDPAHPERGSGYRDWLREQERIEELERRRDFALRVVQDKKTGDAVHRAALDLAASQLLDYLSDVELGEILAEAKNRPDLYVKFVRLVAPLAARALEFSRFAAQVEQARRLADEPNLSSEEIRCRLREILK